MTEKSSNAASTTLILTLLDVAATIERRLDCALSNARGVSFREYLLLDRLSEFPNQRAMRVELASAVGLTPSAVTRALKPLEKLGFVATEKSPRDARQSLAKLAPGGQALLSDTRPIVDDVVASMPAGSLSVSDLGALQAALAVTAARRPFSLSAGKGA